MKRLALAFLALVYCALPAAARVNLLEPWSPGYDPDVPPKYSSHGANLRVGNDSAGGADLVELNYVFNGSMTDLVELGLAWGYTSLDSSGLRDDSGLNDLQLGIKYHLPDTVLERPFKAALEGGISLPTGDPDQGIGAGGIGFLGGAGISYPIQAVQAFARMGLRIYTEGSGTHWGRVIELAAGGEYALDQEWTASADLRYIDHGRDKLDGVSIPEKINEAYLAPGGVWRPTNLPVEFQGSLLLGLTSDAYDFGVMLGAKF